MINIPKIPKLPSREELEYKKEVFLIKILDQFRQTRKLWYAALLAVLVLAFPVYGLLRSRLAALLISRHEPLHIVENPEHAANLVIAETAFLPVSQGIFSAYAHVVNPNSDWSAWSVDYQFVFKDSGGRVLNAARGQSFLLPGSSRFVAEPRVELSATPARVEFIVISVRWTNKVPEANPEFAILQKQWGDIDGKFFVEGSVKNPYSFLIKKVNIAVIIFDSANKRVLAVNRTAAADLQPFEERYFRMLWPTLQRSLLPPAFGQIQVRADVNPLEPGFGLPEDGPLPSR